MQKLINIKLWSIFFYVKCSAYLFLSLFHTFTKASFDKDKYRSYRKTTTHREFLLVFIFIRMSISNTAVSFSSLGAPFGFHATMKRTEEEEV